MRSKSKENYLRKELYELTKTDEDIFDFIQNNAIDGLWYHDLKNPEKIWINARFWKVLGYNPSIMSHESNIWIDTINQNDLKVLKDNLFSHCEGPNHPYDQVVRYTHKNGSTVCMCCRAFAIHDEHGKPIRILGANLNKKENKDLELELLKAKEKAKESDNLLSRTQEIAHIGSWKLDLNTNNLTWSDETFRIFGLEPQEFTPTYEAFLNFIHPDDREKVNIAYSNSLHNGSDSYEIEHRIVRCDTQEIRHVHEKCVHYRNDDGEIIQSIGTVLDITKRKNIELELIRKSRLLEESQEIAHFGSWEYVYDSQTIIWSDEEYQIFGLDSNSAPNNYHNFLNKCVHPDDIDFLHEKFMTTVENQEVFEIEHRIVRPDGSVRSVYQKGKPYFNENGDLSRYVGITHDITKRKKTEIKLKLIESAVEASAISVFIADADGRIIYVNPHFTEVTGYTFEEVRGKNPRFLKSGKQNKAFYTNLWDTIKSGKEWLGKVQNVTKDGELIWVKQFISPILNNHGKVTHFVSIKEDVTKLLKKEDELKHSLKEKEVLLAEIHHRVKNNLAVVAGMMQLQSFDEENPAVQERLSTSVARIKAIAKIHEKLYQHESFSSIDLSENIKDLTYEIVEQLNSGKKINIDLSLSQVQLNINQAVPCSLIVNEVIVNALKHAFIKEKTGDIIIHLSEYHNQVQIKITDNGLGLPDDFTNKTHSSGMMIINVLTEQLYGKYSYKRINTGTEFSLIFEKNNLKGSSSALL